MPRALAGVLSLPATIESLPGTEAIDWSERCWEFYPIRICKALGTVVLKALKQALRDTSWTLELQLPAPEELLETRRIGLRTRRVLTRTLKQALVPARWTARRYLDLPGFGPLRLLDILLALEARGTQWTSAESAPHARYVEDDFALAAKWADGRKLRANGTTVPSRRPPELHVLAKALRFIEQRVPTTLSELEGALNDLGLSKQTLTLQKIQDALVQLGKPQRFERIRAGQIDLVLPKSGALLARLSHATARRYVQETGMANLDSVFLRIRAALGANCKRSSIEESLRHVPSFAWLDRDNGWFWFSDCDSELRPRLLKTILAVREIDVEALRDSVFDARVTPRPSVAAIQSLLTAFPAVALACSDGRTLVRIAFDPVGH